MAAGADGKHCPAVDVRALVASGGAACTCLLLHVWHSGVTPHLRALLAEEHTCKVGVNIGGDVGKLHLDFQMQARGWWYTTRAAPHTLLTSKNRSQSSGGC
jgi:hypothetical protein